MSGLIWWNKLLQGAGSEVAGVKDFFFSFYTGLLSGVRTLIKHFSNVCLFVCLRYFVVVLFFGGRVVFFFSICVA